MNMDNHFSTLYSLKCLACGTDVDVNEANRQLPQCTQCEEWKNDRVSRRKDDKALVRDKNYWNQSVERAILSGEKRYNYESLMSTINNEYPRVLLNRMAVDVHLNPNDYKNKKLLGKAIIKEYLEMFEEFSEEEKTHFEKYFIKIDDIIERFID